MTQKSILSSHERKCKGSTYLDAVLAGRPAASEDLLASAASKAFAEGLRIHARGLTSYWNTEWVHEKLLLNRSSLFVTVNNNGSRVFGTRGNPLFAALGIRHMIGTF